jgi:cell division protein FtsB
MYLSNRLSLMMLFGIAFVSVAVITTMVIAARIAVVADRNDARIQALTAEAKALREQVRLLNQQNAK